MNSRRSTITASGVNVVTNPTSTSTTSTSSSTNMNNNRRQRWPNSSYRRRMSAPMIPPAIVPEQSSFSIEKNTSRRSSDCIDDALAVLRSTKRRKSFGNEGFHQQRDDDDANKSQTPRSEQNEPINPNKETKDKNSTSSSTTSTTTTCSNVFHSSSPSTTTNEKTPGSWEWSIGILPPAPSSVVDQQEKSSFQFARITPMLYPTSSRLVPAGCSTNLSFLSPGLATAVTDYERQEA